MSPATKLIVTLEPEPDAESVRALSGRADILEIRADLGALPDTDWLRSHFEGELLYTLRSRSEGGRSEASPQGRRQRLADAAVDYDLIDLEAQRDLDRRLLVEVPPEKRLLSWHGPPSTTSELQEVFARMAQHEARLYKLVPAAEQPGQELAPLALLLSLRRRDVLAFATGEIGSWTRFVAPRLGAPVLYAHSGESPAAPGQPGLRFLVDDLRYFDLPDSDLLFGIVGNPVGRSLSPRIHNGAYRALGIPALYLPLTVAAFGEFWLEIVESGSLSELGLKLGGLSVTAPHKSIALAVAGATSPLAEWIGSANTLVWHEGVWEAESTDGEGVLAPLLSRGVPLDGRTAAVIGAGGAGRAAAVALTRAGARVALVNRGEERGTRAAEELRIDFVPLPDFQPDRFDVVVHATPVGGAGDEGVPIDPLKLRDDAAVVDLVYRRDEPTPFVRQARDRGCVAVDGREVLLGQAIPQFRIMTGQEMPIREARRSLGLEELP